MNYWLAIIGKGVVIALCAAVAAWGYLFALSLVHPNAGDAGGFESEAAMMIFAFTLLGCFAIGLPVALLTFLFSGKQLAGSPGTLMMVAMLAGIMLVLASYVLGDAAGVMILGVPAFVSVITFAVLGWYWVLKPMQAGEGA